MMTIRVLILGGTTEARQLAERLSRDSRFDATVSLAGRTSAPVAHAVPVRMGGFGGAGGLADHMRRERTDALVDATHPFAATISRNASAAAAETGVPLIVLRRPQWLPGPGDKWTMHHNVEAAIAALGNAPRRVFVTLGRNDLQPLTTAPQHHYLIRSVDPIEPPLALPDANYLLARGPFELESEARLLADYRIDAIITKNSGGRAAEAKLVAARKLGIAVEMIVRPPAGDAPSVSTIEEAADALDHWATSLAERGE